MTFYIGIDPGLAGGVGVVGAGGPIEAHPMPRLGKAVDVRSLRDILGQYSGVFVQVIIEQQSIRPRQSGAMTIGANYGRLLGLLEADAWPYHVVTPAQWNRALKIPSGLTGTAKKQAAYKVAQDRWGHVLDLRPQNDGQVEALLIAEYGRLR